MEQRELPKKYKKEFSHSYSLGPFPTFELLKNRPQAARAVYYDESFNEKEKLISLCGEVGVPCLCWRKALERISQKEICYAAGEFEKFPGALDADSPHVALADPADMGNLGTIQRTILGFGITNLALIGSRAADIWNPKTVRASMGAVFRLNVEHFPDFPSYMEKYGGRDIFPFMLDGADVLTPESCPETKKYTLVFGNEASGLPAEYRNYGRSLFIPQTDAVDSLNLAVSVAIGTYLFTQKNARGQAY